MFNFFVQSLYDDDDGYYYFFELGLVHKPFIRVIITGTEQQQHTRSLDKDHNALKINIIKDGHHLLWYNVVGILLLFMMFI